MAEDPDVLQSPHQDLGHGPGAEPIIVRGVIVDPQDGGRDEEGSQAAVKEGLDEGGPAHRGEPSRRTRFDESRDADDDQAARAGHPPHFFEGLPETGVVLEDRVAQDRIELPVLKTAEIVGVGLQDA